MKRHRKEKNNIQKLLKKKVCFSELKIKYINKPESDSLLSPNKKFNTALKILIDLNKVPSRTSICNKKKWMWEKTFLNIQFIENNP